MSNALCALLNAVDSGVEVSDDLFLSLGSLSCGSGGSVSGGCGGSVSGGCGRVVCNGGGSVGRGGILCGCGGGLLTESVKTMAISFFAMIIASKNYNLI